MCVASEGAAGEGGARLEKGLSTTLASNKATKGTLTLVTRQAIQGTLTLVTRQAIQGRAGGAREGPQHNPSYA